MSPTLGERKADLVAHDGVLFLSCGIEDIDQAGLTVVRVALLGRRRYGLLHLLLNHLLLLLLVTNVHIFARELHLFWDLTSTPPRAVFEVRAG